MGWSKLRDTLLRSIHARLMILILIVSLVPLILIGLLTYRASSGIIEESVTSNSTEAIDQVLDNIEFHLQEMEFISMDIVFNERFASQLNAYKGDYDEAGIGAVNEIKATLNKQLSVRNSIRSVFILTEQLFIISTDNTYVSANTSPIPRLLREQDWYAKSLDYGGRSLFTAVKDADTGEYEAIRLSKLFRDIHTGKPLGVLAVDMHYRVIDRLVSKLHPGFHGSLFLVDGDGRIIYGRDPGAYRRDAASVFDPVLRGGKADGVDTVEVGGEQLLRIHRTSGVSGWKVIELIPYTKLMAPVHAIKSLTVVLVLVCFVGVVVVSVYVSSRLLGPLKSFNRLMKKVQHGDLDVKLDVVRQDEIGLISRNFNMMTARLKEMRTDMVREQERKREAELAALQAQINPHFLYNTLDSIKWMAVIKGEHNIGEMITALVRLLRGSINRGKELIPLRQEIENVRHYITIQQMRYFHSFEMHYEIAPETLSCAIPKLILQPLVENALFHGIEDMEKGGVIRLIIGLEGPDVVCRVIDNGKGLSPEQLGRILEGPAKTKFSGISIKNVDERLKLHFGSEYGLRFRSVEGSMTEVVLRVPATDMSGNEKQEETAHA